MKKMTTLKPQANSDIEPQSKTTAQLCARRPCIEFDGKAFCFTGRSGRMPRESIAEIVLAMGAFVHDDVTRKTDFLVVGSKGSRTWKHGSYGRKMERAMRLKENAAVSRSLERRTFGRRLGSE